MDKLDLRNVTLIAFDTKFYSGTARAIDKCVAKASFRDCIWFTDLPSAAKLCESDPGIVLTDTFASKEETSVFTAHTLPNYIVDHSHLFGEFTLMIQWDGWIVSPQIWTDLWFEYDCIGAPWPDGVVGNDGFCLRSKVFWEAVAGLDLAPDVCHPGDVALCRHNRERLEEKGVKFADTDVASRFSVENQPWSGSFGFHGTHTLLDLARKGLLD